MTTGILIATALWHFAAVLDSLFYPARTLARSTSERPVNRIAVELFRFLGGINVAFTVLALATLRLNGPARGPALLALSVANASQFLVDLRVKRLGLVHGTMFHQILVGGDGVFTVLNLVALWDCQ